MSRLPFYLLLGCCAAIAPQLTANPAKISCDSQIKGGFLMGSLLDISLTTNELQLLNGREDPKLKRHLEWRLVSAVASARRQIDEGATVERSSAIPNMAHGVERATVYITGHVVASQPSTPSDTHVTNPLEDLKVVKKWLSEQP